MYLAQRWQYSFFCRVRVAFLPGKSNCRRGEITLNHVSSYRISPWIGGSRTLLNTALYDHPRKRRSRSAFRTTHSELAAMAQQQVPGVSFHPRY